MIRILIHKLLRILNLRVMFESNFAEYLKESGFNAERSTQLENLENVTLLLAESRSDFFGKLIPFVRFSKSQIGQDLWVLSSSNYKRGGFFIEVGAHDGFHLSNTILLEQKFSWSGILIEPVLESFEKASNQRTSKVVNAYVSGASDNEVDFFHAVKSEYSTRRELIDSDYHSINRIDGKIIQLRTKTLVEVLKEHSAPECIDYISIDTEGSEYEILEFFDFNYFRVNFWTIEHNNGPNQARLDSLLRSKGYKNVRKNFGEFESWYYRE